MNQDSSLMKNNGIDPRQTGDEEEAEMNILRDSEKKLDVWVKEIAEETIKASEPDNATTTRILNATFEEWGKQGFDIVPPSARRSIYSSIPQTIWKWIALNKRGFASGIAISLVFGIIVNSLVANQQIEDILGDTLSIFVSDFSSIQVIAVTTFIIFGGIVTIILIRNSGEGQ